MARTRFQVGTLSSLLLAMAPLAVLARGEEVKTQGGTGALLLDEVQTSWSELSRKVEVELQGMVPRLEALESLGRPLNKDEKEEISSAYQLLKPQQVS